MSLHVEHHGGGPPDAAIVLAHGFAGSARNFRPQLRALGRGYRIHVYDAPGHARSGPCQRGDLDELAAAFGEVAIAARRASGDAPLLAAGGLSLGAWTALHWVAGHPTETRSLVLLSPPGAGGLSRVASHFADAIDHDGLEAAGERFVWGPDSGLGESGRQLVRQGFLEHRPGCLARLLRGALSEAPPLERWRAQLAALALPVLLIAGQRDLAAREAARALARDLPCVRLVEVPEAGHVVNLEAAAAVNAALTDFLERVAAETPVLATGDP